MTSSLLPTYARADLAFDHGDGAWLTATTGERYLDFGGGIAVASLGYSHPHLVATLIEQGGKLWHTSNLFQIPQAERLAARLYEASFADLCLLHQFRRRSRRRRDQNRAQISIGERASGEIPYHHLRRGFPRPHYRYRLGGRKSKISRRVWSAARGL